MTEEQAPMVRRELADHALDEFLVVGIDRADQAAVAAHHHLRRVVLVAQQARHRSEDLALVHEFDRVLDDDRREEDALGGGRRQAAEDMPAAEAYDPLAHAAPLPRAGPRT